MGKPAVTKYVSLELPGSLNDADDKNRRYHGLSDLTVKLVQHFRYGSQCGYNNPASETNG